MNTIPHHTAQTVRDDLEGIAQELERIAGWVSNVSTLSNNLTLLRSFPPQTIRMIHRRMGLIRHHLGITE